MSEIKGFKETTENMYALHKKKNSDYAGSKDPYKNFRQCESLDICSVEQGILVRMSDKMSRISTLIGENKEAEVTDEKLEDTLLDLANYSVILKCFLENGRKKK